MPYRRKSNPHERPDDALWPIPAISAERPNALAEQDAAREEDGWPPASPARETDRRATEHWWTPMAVALARTAR